jgi:hypothetical protein
LRVVEDSRLLDVANSGGEQLFRQHWRDPGFWMWWWQRKALPTLRYAAIGGFFVLLGGFGMYVSFKLSSASAISAGNASTVERTVERSVIVYRKEAPARRVTAHVRVVTRRIVDYVPTTRVELRTRTAVVTRNRVVTNTAVVTRTVIRKQTVTRTEPRLVMQTVTQSVTETAPPITATETLPPTTVVVTVTVTRGHG